MFDRLDRYDLLLTPDIDLFYDLLIDTDFYERSLSSYPVLLLLLLLLYWYC